MNSHKSHVIVLVVVCFVAFWLGGRSAARTPEVSRETAYARVMRTGVLRCGYIVYPPETIKDPNTGKLSGTVVETTEEVARQLGLKVEWVAEVGFQDMFEGLRTGRYDSLCSGLREDPTYAKAALFSMGMMFGTSYVFVRSDDARFDSSLAPIDDPRVKIAQIDGEGAQVIASESFPKAAAFLLPPMSDISMVLESVASKKADVAFLQAAAAQNFMQSHSGKLKMLTRKPARTWLQPLMAFAHGEHDLKYIIDAALRALHENGFIERTLRKYDPKLVSYMLLASPYTRAK